MFIAIEGIDGCGKTTLCKELKRRHPEWVMTHEPSELVPLGMLVQNILDGHTKAPPEAMLGLFTAARLQHLEYLDSLAIGHEDLVIVCDRYIGSTMVYQQTHWAMETIIALQEPCRWPDVGIYLKIDPDLAAERSPDLYPHIGDLKLLSDRYDQIFAQAWPQLGSVQTIIDVGEYVLRTGDLADAVESTLDAAQSARPDRKP